VGQERQRMRKYELVRVLKLRADCHCVLDKEDSILCVRCQEMREKFVLSRRAHGDLCRKGNFL
jgi:hypothetical protein